MSRISREQMFMDICEVIARRSTCGRGNVGAILVTEEHNIVSIGYNGPPSGEPHCKLNNCEKNTTGGCLRSVHAERNAIKRAPMYNAFFDMYVTVSPCINCANDIIRDKRIRRVYFRQEYRIRDGITHLMNNGIEVYKVTPAGYVIEVGENEFV